MIIDYYKFKVNGEISDKYHLTYAASQSDRIPPEQIRFVYYIDKTTIYIKYRLIFDNETTAHVIFPRKNYGIGCFESSDDLILVRWFPEISRIHIMIIHNKRMYAEVLYQKFNSGLIEFNQKPANPDNDVQ